MIVCMEYIARCINSESVFENWLNFGVPGGDIEQGNLDPSQIDDNDYMISDEGFKDLMTVFLRRMAYAYKDGGLYCDGITSEDING